MHEGQVPTSVDLARRLLARQFPQWADLPVTPVAEAGTDHALYRLGDDLLLRLPIVAWAEGQADRDARWLPAIAPHLPLTVPVPVAVGEPDEEYPWRWSVVPWLPGEAATPDRLDLATAADDLAGLVRALHALPTDGGPAKTGTARGVPLARLDTGVRETLRVLEADGVLPDTVECAAVARAWDDAVAAEPWGGPPVWLHGDLQPGNLLAHGGRLRSVIDFGGLGLGDPAPDLAPAWNIFDSSTRGAFLDAVGYDDQAVRRARGWVLAPALSGIGYYRDSRPDLASAALSQIEAVLADAS
jgi:aminoglycoside phosphotransferase (APT) family kinase protein